MKLNARQVETAKPKEKTYKMADGGGLYLEVTTKGSKYWRVGSFSTRQAKRVVPNRFLNIWPKLFSAIKFRDQFRG